jgi:hypothetical protein
MGRKKPPSVEAAIFMLRKSPRLVKAVAQWNIA